MSRTNIIILLSVLGAGVIAYVIYTQARRQRQRLDRTYEILNEPEVPVYTLAQDPTFTTGTEINPVSTPEQDQILASNYGFMPSAINSNISLYN
jgi:hypothetical protein